MPAARCCCSEEEPLPAPSQGGLAASRRHRNLQLGKPGAAASARGCLHVTPCSTPWAIARQGWAAPPPSPQPGSLRTHQQVAARPSPVARWMGSDGQGGTRAGHRKGSSSVKIEQERGQAAGATAAPQAAATATSPCQQSRAQGHRTPEEANSRLAAAPPHLGCRLVAAVGQAPPSRRRLDWMTRRGGGAGEVGGGGARWAVRVLNQNGGRGCWVGVVYVALWARRWCAEKEQMEGKSTELQSVFVRKEKLWHNANSLWPWENFWQGSTSLQNSNSNHSVTSPQTFKKRQSGRKHQRAWLRQSALSQCNFRPDTTSTLRDTAWLLWDFSPHSLGLCTRDWKILIQRGYPYLRCLKEAPQGLESVLDFNSHLGWYNRKDTLQINL